MVRRYWTITVTDGLEEAYSTKIARGDIFADALREMLIRLAIHHARLTPDEIVHVAKDGQGLLTVSMDGRTVSLANVTATARWAEGYTRRVKAAGIEVVKP